MRPRKLLTSLLMTASVLSALGAEATGTPEADAVNATSAASAEPATNSGQLAEVVVTAEKRVSTVQNTPISISAVSRDALQSRGVTSLAGPAGGAPGGSLQKEGARAEGNKRRGR